MHLITLNPWSETDILETVEDSLNIKKYPEKYRHAVGGKSLCLLFQKTSTRTRCAGEIGIYTTRRASTLPRLAHDKLRISRPRRRNARPLCLCGYYLGSLLETH